MSRKQMWKPKDIKVLPRFRKDLGDLTSLMESMNEVGLIQPIVITPEGVLLAGERRLQAAKNLGWPLIKVNIFDLDPIRVEHDENQCRKEFTISERAAIAAALKEEIAAKRQRELDERRSEIHRIAQAKWQAEQDARDAAGDGSEQTEAEVVDSDHKDTDDSVQPDHTVDEVAKESDEEKQEPPRSREQAAHLAGFQSWQTAQRAKVVVDSGNAELIKLMDAKRVPITRAAAIAQMGPEEQAQAIAEITGKGKKVEQAGSSAVQDGLGTLVPDNLKDVFSDTAIGKALEWMRCLIDGISRDKPLVSLASKCDALGYVPYEIIQDLVDKAKVNVKLAVSRLEGAVPYAVCPACEGTAKSEGETECFHCRATGYMTKYRYDEYQSELATGEVVRDHPVEVTDTGGKSESGTTDTGGEYEADTPEADTEADPTPEPEKAKRGRPRKITV